MPQIAQQDYNVIEISRVDEPTTDDKLKLYEAFRKGIIFDTVVKCGNEYMRVITFEDIPADELNPESIVFWLFGSSYESMISISYTVQ